MVFLKRKCVNYLGYNVFLDLKSHEHGLIHIVQDKNMLVARFNKSITATGFEFTGLETRSIYILALREKIFVTV